MLELPLFVVPPALGPIKILLLPLVIFSPAFPPMQVLPDPVDATLPIAELPTTVLEFPLTANANALVPTAVLFPPTVVLPAWNPSAVLLIAETTDDSALRPTAVFWIPVMFEVSAAVPIATILSTVAELASA